MPLPTHIPPPLSPLRKALLAAAATVIVMGAYIAYAMLTIPYPDFVSLTDRCSMTVTVVSTHGDDAAQTRFKAATSTGEAIEVMGSTRAAPGEQIAVWRTTGADGRFIYDVLESIPPMRK